MPNPDKSFISKLVDMLGRDRDDVEERLQDLDLDPMLDLIDAVSANDLTRAREILAVEQDESQENDGSDIDADLSEINPLFTSAKAGSPKKKAKSAPVDEEEDFLPNVGDEVRVGDDEGTVKIAHGPGDTVGVQIDGETTMVKQDEVKRGLQEGALMEGLLGMTGMSSLGRMQELAGIKPTIGMIGGMGLDMAPECEAEGPVAVPGTCPEDGVAMAPPPPPPAPIAPPPPAPESVPSVHFDGAPCMDLGGMLKSFDEIERGLQDLKVRDAKEVRQRINSLLMKLNESAAVRRRKV